MMVETKDPGAAHLEDGHFHAFGPKVGAAGAESEEDGESSEGEDEADDEPQPTICGCTYESRLKLFKITVNVILPLIWIALGGWYSRDYYSLYLNNSDSDWEAAGAGAYNDVDRDLINFTITAVWMFAGGLVISGLLAGMKMVTLRKYLEMAICTSIVGMGLIYMFAFGETTDGFYYSALNAWAVTTVTFAGFLLIYHIVVYVDYMCPCCCQGDGCCDWNYEFKEETASEIDRLDSIGIKLEVEDLRDKIQGDKMETEYAQKMRNRAEKKARRKAREAKRKERRKRKAEKFRQDKEEWDALKRKEEGRFAKYFLFC